MSRKHFEVIAASLNDSLRAAVTECERKTVTAVAYTMAANLSGENAKFNVDTFLRACGVRK